MSGTEPSSVRAGKDDVRRAVQLDTDDRKVFEDRVKRWGTTSVHPFLGEPGMRSVLVPRGAGAFVPMGRWSVCPTGPAARPGREREVLDAFAEQLPDGGRRTVLVAVVEPEPYVARGMHAVEIADDALISLPQFGLAGKRMASIRHSVAAAHRAGLRVVPFDEAHVDGVARVSQSWLATERGGELGFTLGRFDPAHLRRVECRVALDAHDEVAGFVTWHAFDDGRGRVLDMMRRGLDAPNPTMDLLIADGLGEFARRGVLVASLGSVPRSHGRLGEHVYPTASLRRYKEKFRADVVADVDGCVGAADGCRVRCGRSRTRTAPTACSGRCVAMRDDIRATLREVRRRCVHPPLVTVVCITAVIAAAVRAGVVHHDLDLVTSFRYGYSARALSMGHYGTVWTSQFLSRDPFMAVSMSLSLALMLGVYEMIAGSWRALVVAVASAVMGLLLVSGGLAIGAVLGSQFASRTLSTLDYGGSVVTAGGGGALVAVLGMRRLRWFAVFWVVFGLVAHHQIADWEHLCAFATGYGVGHGLGVPTAAPSGQVRVWTRPFVAAALVLAIVLGAGVAGATVPSGTGLTATHHTFHVPTLHRQTGASASASPPRIVPITFPTPALGGTKTGYVVLPPGYDQTHVRYPVVEMLHGRPGSPNDIVTGLDPAGAEYLPGVPPFIGVIPDGHGPKVYDGEFADTSKQKLGTALSDDLRTWIDAHYRTNGDWTITGLSSGGYGAAYLASWPEGGYTAACR